MCKRYLLLALFIVAAASLSAQRKKNPPATKSPAIPPPSVASTPSASKAGPKPYKEVITSKAVTQKGMFLVHKLDDRFFFELPDSILNRDVLVVSRISKAAAGGRAQFIGYAGDQIGENVISFEKGPNNKLFLKSISYMEYSNDTTSNGMYRSVLNSNLQPIAASFDVKAYGKDSASGASSTVIDVTEYISGDNDILFFDANVKRSLSLTAIAADRSYVQDVKAYPMNVEIKTVKTYTKAPPPNAYGAGTTGPATYELNSSLVLLPGVPMKARYFDNRVGYFATGYTDFDANPQGIEKVSMITRFRLEPKAADVEKYKRGELVEPKNPIIYYIDPATPKKWVPYLIAGINDWQVAFEKAGFKNAIIAKEAPVNDSTWSLEDARHNVVIYKPSDIPNASGPHVHDPRSGEIMETHINWYHNVMSLLRNWYMVQAGAVDAKARKMKFDDELMGQLIRFVSSHEVGHTLGLRHNFGSSSTVPVENLRNKAWVEAHGHTPSIMDYARFNYVAQPEDNISEKGLFPRIGEYDLWAIEWGYRWKPEYKTAAEEKEWLNKWIVEKLSANKRLWFGEEEYYSREPAFDPRRQNEDLGDNAMKAGAYGIKNLQRILTNLQDWTKEPNEGYDNLAMMYKEVLGQYNRYMGHVAKNIGGVMTTPKSIEQKGNVYEYVPKEKQKEAMQFLQEQLFKTPVWILNKKIFSVTGANGISIVGNMQNAMIDRLMGASTMEKLIAFEASDPAGAYKASEMLYDLKRGIWSELPLHRSTDLYRRNLQKMYVDQLIDLIKAVSGDASQMQLMVTGRAGMNMAQMSDIPSIIRGHTKSLLSEIKVAIPATADAATRLHLQDVQDRLTSALDPKK
jgi:hypothetical protein